LVADSHSILARWRNHFSQLLNIREVNDIRQTEIHTAEPLVTKPSAFESELNIVKLKSHKFPGIDQIPAELIKAVSRKTRHEIHKVIISIWNKEELPEEWKKSIIYKKGDKTDCSNYRDIYFCELRTKFYTTSCCQGYLHMQRKLLGIICVDLEATGQLLIIYCAFVRYLRRNGNTTKQCISSL